MPEVPKRDTGPQTQEIFKNLNLLRTHQVELKKAFDLIRKEVSTISVSLPQSPTGAASTQQIEALQRTVQLLESVKQKESHILNELKSEISVWLGEPLIKEDPPVDHLSHLRGSEPPGAGLERMWNGGWKGPGSSSDEVRYGQNFSNEKMMKEKDKKILELSDLVDVYATIVSQHDREQKLLSEKEKSQKTYGSSELNSEMEHLQMSLEAAQQEKRKIQKQYKAAEEEACTLRKEKELAEEKIQELEIHLLSACHWHKALMDAVCPKEGGDDPAGLGMSIRELLSQKAAAPERIRAKIISPDAWMGGKRDGSQRPGTPASSFGPSLTPKYVNPLFTELRSLSPITMRNPSNHERKLLQRIALYESKLGELEQYEMDRKKSFDEMEKTRAELFTSMNDELKKRKRTIQNLSMERDSLRQLSSSQRTSSVREGDHDSNGATPSASPEGRDHSVESHLLQPHRMTTEIREDKNNFTSPDKGKNQEEKDLPEIIALIVREEVERLEMERQELSHMWTTFNSFTSSLLIELPQESLKEAIGGVEAMTSSSSTSLEPLSTNHPDDLETPCAPPEREEKAVMKKEGDSGNRVPPGVLKIAMEDKERCASEALLVLYGECLEALRGVLQHHTSLSTDLMGGLTAEDEADIGFAVKAIEDLRGR